MQTIRFFHYAGEASAAFSGYRISRDLVETSVQSDIGYECVVGIQTAFLGSVPSAFCVGHTNCLTIRTQQRSLWTHNVRQRAWGLDSWERTYSSPSGHLERAFRARVSGQGTTY